MATDIYGRVKFNDGEALDLADLDGLGARVLASLWDQLVSSMPPDLGTATDDPKLNQLFDPTTSPYAFAVTCVGGRPIQGTANNKVKISKGTLCQAIAAPDGSEPKFLAYTSDGTREVTIANGDASNPRVDLIQMKLTYVEDTAVARDFEDAVTRAKSSITPNTRRRVDCAITVKQGTPAASPTYPTLDAGCVTIAGVLVGTNYVAAAGFLDEDTTGAVAVLHDQRLPMSVVAQMVRPQHMDYDASVWSLGSAAQNMLTAGAGANTSAVVAMPVLASQGRIIAVQSFSNTKTAAAPGGATFNASRLVKYKLADSGGSLVASPTDLAHTFMDGGSSGFARRGTRMGSWLHTPAAGPTITASAAGVGPPVWNNGRRAPGIVGGSFPVPIEMVGFRQLAPTSSSGAGALVGPVNFWIAVGL